MARYVRPYALRWSVWASSIGIRRDGMAVKRLGGWKPNTRALTAKPPNRPTALTKSRRFMSPVSRFRYRPLRPLEHAPCFRDEGTVRIRQDQMLKVRDRVGRPSVAHEQA